MAHHYQEFEQPDPRLVKSIVDSCRSEADLANPEDGDLLIWINFELQTQGYSTFSSLKAVKKFLKKAKSLDD